MDRRRFLSTSAALGLAGCGNPSAITSFTYRLRVTVFVDGADHVGESVIKVDWKHLKGTWQYGPRFRTRGWGEAPVIDLGAKHGLLFALLQGLSRMGDSAFDFGLTPPEAVRSNPPHPGRDMWDHVRALQKQTGERELGLGQLPLLARFGDLGEPGSVEQVFPDKMAETYGDSARFKRATIEMVEAEPADSILAVLPWLDGLTTSLAPRIEGASDQRRFAQSLGAGHFRQQGFHDW